MDLYFLVDGYKKDGQNSTVVISKVIGFTCHFLKKKLDVFVNILQG